MLGRIERGLLSIRRPAAAAQLPCAVRRGAVRRRGAARDTHALAVLFDLDFGQAGFVQKLGELVDQFVVDQR